MKQILFFNPYTPWLPHTLWETTMAHALRQRGHSVRFITCSGLPDCGVAPVRLGHSEDLCQNCRNITGITLPQMRHKAEFLQSALTGKEQERIAAWAAALSVDEFQTAEYAGLPIGAWTRADIVSYWHTLEPQLEREEVATSYRNLLVGAATAALAMPRLYDKFNTDILVTLNGSFFLHRVAVEVAKARGIRVIIHERGWMDNTVGFVTSGIAGDMEGYQQRWEQWRDVPLTRPELDGVAKLLRQRRQGTNMNWSAFSPTLASRQDRTQICHSLGLPDRPLALLCTSSDCEGSLADRARALDQRAWIAHTVDWFRAHEEYVLVIRVHPNELEHAKVDDRILEWYRQFKPTLPANVALILPEEKVSTYGLMFVASAGLSYGSTAGLEMACLGIPVVHAGIGYYKDCGFTHEIDSVDQIAPVMATVMTLPPDRTTQQLAFRFMHRLFIGICVPFSKVKINKDYFRADLNYQSIAELAPGRDRDLDRISEYVLGNAPLFPAPTPLEQSRTTAEEDAFFGELEQLALAA